MSHFTLQCRGCKKKFDDAGAISLEHCKNALVVTNYTETLFIPSVKEGIWRFNWLPVHTPSFHQPGPVVYKSSGLSARLGLEDLSVVFNGFWPEKNAFLATCTFKEFEAAVVLQNALERGARGLVVASAGNTARAFSHLSSLFSFPVVIIVPSLCLTDMWYLESAPVPTVAVGDGDYADSIDVAKRFAQTLGFPFEGGVMNAAKRDGLGVVLLEYVSKTGRLPAHYFQAVGSGTGAIGVWEMAERFLKDGRFGAGLPVLHLAQNLPFAPMAKAWERDSRDILPEDLRPELIAEITTRVLSTRYPAYAIEGGVYDALKATGGKMYGMPNEAVYKAMDLFKEAEGIDIVPAAGVAVAALKESVEKGMIRGDDSILLNITGGGEGRLREEKETYAVEPLIISKKISDREIEALLCSVLKKNS